MLAIRAEGISKLYRIGAKERVKGNLADSVLELVRSPFTNYRKYRSLYSFNDVVGSDAPSDVIWALKDVSFEVREGEVLGVIGRNGAGKSTLLKILSRITPPTHGRVQLHGRVGSLLEVGTGFHQELTGRENVYLNGTILGMKKREIDRKFDEIVAFAGAERFLDTPVKRYSTGMRVRLAFAVAAHLEPEILIIDEVLAVGDAAFQRKCLDKMDEVRQHGRTVLFVSHNMPAVTGLCSRAILLDGGGLIASGPTREVVSTYLDSTGATMALREWPDEATAPGGKVARLRAVRVINRRGELADMADIRSEIGLQMEYEVLKPGHLLLPHFYLYNDEGVVVFGTLDQDARWKGRPRPAGRYISTAWIPGNLLSEGVFLVNCNLMTRDPDVIQFWERRTVSFHVVDSMEGDTARGDWQGTMAGVVRPILPWTTEYHASGETNMNVREA
jgi:lipopolysaccharide transport system ATP-binding protein